MAAMTRGEGAAPRHGEIGDIEIRHAGQPGLVGQALQVVNEVGVTVIAQPLAADHLIAGPCQRQGHGIFQATGRVAADGFCIEGAGGEQQGSGEHGTPEDGGLRQPQAYQELRLAVIRAAVPVATHGRARAQCGPTQMRQGRFHHVRRMK
ncbi:hypothetical protein D3C84_472270 [compost metagenome]